MPVPRCDSDASHFCSFRTQLNRDCNGVRPPEPFVDLGDEPFIVGWPVLSTMAKEIALGNEIQQEQLQKPTQMWVGNDSNEKTHVFSTEI
jgi:hypothetical protein